MADFLKAYNTTKRHEGGYSNNPKDRGGETYKGISRKNFPLWLGWVLIDSHKTKKGNTTTIIERELLADQALDALVISFYKSVFWDALSLDQVSNQPIANELFDTSVNMGVGTAAIYLQRSLNVLNRNGKDYADLMLDGKVGLRTIQVLNQHKKPEAVLKVLNCLQGAKYVSICEANPSQEDFMFGWLERVTL